jgi:peptidyl-prolyl cis-trans isomerase B (cyclophilin B)
MLTKYYILIFIALFFLSCSASKEDSAVQKSEKQPKSTSDKKLQEVDNTVLNKKNAVSFLTEYAKNNLENTVIMRTSLGEIKIKLYDEAPLHRANFIRLVKKKFYDETLFYRVIKGFVVQGGGSDDLAHGRKKRKIGKYTLPAEFNEKYFHKKGALAAARNYENNPDKRSNPFDFYFVHGNLYDKLTLDALALENELEFNQIQQNAYFTIGGAPHLDNEHTVFGEVTKGLDIIDEIANREVGEGDWPLENVFIETITIVE